MDGHRQGSRGQHHSATQIVVLDTTPSAALSIRNPAPGPDGVAHVARLSPIEVTVAGATKVGITLRNAAGLFFNRRTFGRTPSVVAATRVGGSFVLRLPAGLILPSGRCTIQAQALDEAGAEHRHAGRR